MCAQVEAGVVGSVQGGEMVAKEAERGSGRVVDQRQKTICSFCR